MPRIGSIVPADCVTMVFKAGQLFYHALRRARPFAYFPLQFLQIVPILRHLAHCASLPGFARALQRTLGLLTTTAVAIRTASKSEHDIIHDLPGSPARFIVTALARIDNRRGPA